MLGAAADSERSKVGSKNGGRSEVLWTASESAPTGGSPTDLDIVPQCTLKECSRDSTCLIDVECFSFIAEDRQNVAIYNRNRIERDSTSGAWTLRLVGLRT